MLDDTGTFDNAGTSTSPAIFDNESPRSPTSAALNVTTAGVVEPGTFAQRGTGVTSFAHDAAGDTRLVLRRNTHFGGCIGTSGPNLPTGTELSVVNTPYVTGQYTCTRFRFADLRRGLSRRWRSSCVATDVMATAPAFTSGTEHDLYRWLLQHVHRLGDRLADTRLRRERSLPAGVSSSTTATVPPALSGRRRRVRAGSTRSR